jgi:hypothetical protein
MSPPVERDAIDTKQFKDIFLEHFCSDDPPFPPDVKTLQDFSAYLHYKSIFLVDGEERDPLFLDTLSFQAQITKVILV